MQVEMVEVKRRMDAEDERIVELQASLMRRWIKATAEWRRGECTDSEYEDYCNMLRGIAHRTSQESCKHHGKSPAARAKAYAAPIRIGELGSCLGSGAGVSVEADVVVPSIPPASKWAYIPSFIKGGTNLRMNFGRYPKVPEKAFSMVREAHPKTLRRRHEDIE